MQEIQQSLSKKYMTKFLFIGTFLSTKFGTNSVVERMKESLQEDEIELVLASSYSNKIVRFLDVMRAILFYKEEKIFFGVFSGLAFKMTEWGSILAKLRGKKIYYTLHGGALHEFTDKHKAKVLKVFSRADYIQTPSLFLKAYFEKLGFQIHYLPNPISLDDFPYQRKVINPHSLLWVRAFTSIYNPALAIKSLYEVKKEFPEATLTMVGPNKGMLADMKTLIKSLNLENDVRIVGPVDNKILHTYYQTHAVYLNTTSYESFGKAIVEAGSCGIPIVSTSVGEIPFIWQNQSNILLIQNASEIDMAEKIKRIFNDTEFSKQLSMNARVNAEKFDWKNVKPMWMNLFNE